MHTKTHSHIHGHTPRIHIATKNSKHMHVRALSFLTLLVLLEAIPHSLRNPTSVKHATWWSTLMFSFQGNDEYAGTCQRKKTCGRQSLALRDVGHIQEIAHRDHASCSATRERGYTEERERRCKRIHLQYLPVFHRSLTKMTTGWKNAAGAPSVRFLVNFSV